ncbi:RidA family protein [Streptomyces sp. MMCC 100]|uniref:RidA family protein n=1 Tax=Streptomyces sp. MMCC 100 TaxID=3163555 RepID=UPI003597B1BF
MNRFINEAGSDPSKYGLSSGAVAGNMVFAAAMALDGQTMRRDAAAVTVADETRICLEQLEGVLKEAGCGLKDIVKINCYLTRDEDRAEFWQTYDQIFAAIDTQAVRITQVVGIACGCRVELDAVAVAP